MEVFLIIGLVVSIPLGYVLDGWVLTKLWAWFVIPTFGLPALSIVPAIGLSVIVGYLTEHAADSKSSGDDKSIEQKLGELIGKTIFIPLFYLFVGWVFSLFM